MDRHIFFPMLDNIRCQIYHTQIWPSDHDIVAISGQALDIAGYENMRHILIG